MIVRTGIARRLAVTATAILAGAALAVATAAPASASSFDGTCNSGEVCLYYWENFGGAMADFYDDVSNYGNWHFWNSSLPLDNDTMSLKNRAVFNCVTLFRDANFRGGQTQYDTLSDAASLYPHNNENSGHSFSTACLFPPP